MIILKWLYTAWVALTFGILMLIGYLVFRLCSLFFSKGKAQRYMLDYNKFWVNTWCAITGIGHEVIGLEKVDKNQAYVFIPNHTSILDATVLNLAIPDHPFRPMAKIELTKVPILGYLFQQTSVIVDRADPDSRKKSVVTMKEGATQHGFSSLIFPEGTRNKLGEVPVLPFKTGAFRIAIELQLPLVPIAIIGARQLLNKGKPPVNRCTVTAIYGDPIDTKGLTQEDAYDLKAQAFAQMEQIIIEHDPDFAHLKA